MPPTATPSGTLDTLSSSNMARNVKPATAPANMSRKREKKTVKIDLVQKSVTDLSKRSPLHSRQRLRDRENYEEPVSGREDWWRCHLKETPIPGAYEHDDFLKDLDKRPNSYRFKSDGRKTDPYPYGKGSLLLPGAYEKEDFIQRLDRYNTTYGFKGSKRSGKDFLNFGIKDKDINVSPNAYSVEKYLTLTVERQPSKHWVFKSQSQRFPTIHFKPRDGPAPGNYENPKEQCAHSVSSSFMSKTPRFRTAHTKVPGPGMYEKTFQSPMPGTIVKMGRQHGLFFSSAFQV